jgi:hypothetical protein
MITLTKEKIREIYQELDCGMRCFYNPDTNEIKSWPDPDSFHGLDNEIG